MFVFSTLRRIILPSLCSITMVSQPLYCYAETVIELLIDEFNIPTFTAQQKSRNVYELLEGYVMTTQQCYENAFWSEVILTQHYVVFADSGEVCVIKNIVRN